MEQPRNQRKGGRIHVFLHTSFSYCIYEEFLRSQLLNCLVARLGKTHLKESQMTTQNESRSLLSILCSSDPFVFSFLSY